MPSPCFQQKSAENRALAKGPFPLARIRIFANRISSGPGSGFLKNDPEKKKGTSFLLMKSLFANVREVTRTPDLPLRRRSLYPTELRGHIQFLAYLLGFSPLGSHPEKSGPSSGLLYYEARAFPHFGGWFQLHFSRPRRHPDTWQK